MKKYVYTQNFERAHKVIESEKSELSDGCKSLILQDFTNTFSRYFELSEPPKMQLSPEGKGYSVSVTFSASLIKKFNVLK